VDRLSEREKVRIAELVAVGAPAWRLHREVHRSRWAIRRYVNWLQRPAPPARKRSPLRLSLTEREEISRGLVGRESLRAIAVRLGRSPSTISREVHANGGVGGYRACRADDS
jgi:transposase, IS30 family